MSTPSELPREPLPRVLVVEDNADIAMTMSLLLRAMGYNSFLARSGAEAIAVAERERPEIVLLDIGLPDMNGYEVAEQLRAHATAEPPIIVGISGYGEDSDRSRAAGLDMHLVKPVSLEALRSALQQHSAQAESR